MSGRRRLGTERGTRRRPPFARLGLAVLLTLVAGQLTTALAQNTGFRVDDYIKASNTDPGDEFGQSVAISGDLMAFGAYREESSARNVGGGQLDNTARDAGAVYVYVRDNNRWQLDAYIKPNNMDAGDRFGWSVALDGDRLVVGAPEEDGAGTGLNANPGDNSASNAGAVYLFERVRGRWQQSAYLKASNTDARDRFGTAVAIDGDTIVVGAPDEDSNARGINGDQSNNSSLNSGAVYVFRKPDNRWFQEAYIKASNTGGGDRFGSAVDIHRDTIVVGAPAESSDAIGVDGDQGNNFALEAGAAYVLNRADSFWNQTGYLKPFNTDPGDRFGTAVAIGELDIVVGAVGEDGSSPGVNGEFDDLRRNAGAAYSFIRDGRFWFGVDYLKASNPDFDDAFGSAVDLDRLRLVVTAVGEDSNATGLDGDDANNGASDSGAAWTFNRNGRRWVAGQYLKAPNTDRGDRFGTDVALQAGVLLVGASGEESNATGVNGNAADNTLSNAGAAYRYSDSGAFPVTINPGMADAWLNPLTAGQGYFVNVYPELALMFVGWFTYDLRLPEEGVEADFGWAGHRWLVAQGSFSGDTADLDVYLTTGGRFNQEEPMPEEEGVIGTMRILWLDCEQAFLIYDLTRPVISGAMPLRRGARDGTVLCEAFEDALD